MTTYAQQERAALADALEAAGPDAATLCEGWDTADLAAHLVIRERRPDASPGIVFPPLADHMERVRVATRDGTDYPELVRQFRGGPPAWSPIRLSFLDSATNTVEYFVHLEDVRRAGPSWAPRELDEGLDRYLWGRLKRGAQLLMRKAPADVVLRTPDGRSTTVKTGRGATVTLTGEPAELTLVAFGRGAHARVEAEGDPADVEAVLSGKYGV